MKNKNSSHICVSVIAAALIIPAHADSYYGYDERDHHDGKNHVSNTEKAVAGALVAGLAIAAANAASQKNGEGSHESRPSAQSPYDLPQAAHKGHNDTVIVRIRGENGDPLPIYLRRSGNGFTGPRGEYYASLPDARTLRNVYGFAKQPAAQPQPKVHVEQGRVVVKRGDRVLCTVRPAMANVEQFRLVNNNQQLVVKSRGGHGPSTVELFNLSNGSLDDKILGYAIRNGQPKWAKGMQD